MTVSSKEVDRVRSIYESEPVVEKAPRKITGELKKFQNGGKVSSNGNATAGKLGAVAGGIVSTSAGAYKATNKISKAPKKLKYKKKITRL